MCELKLVSPSGFGPHNSQQVLDLSPSLLSSVQKQIASLEAYLIAVFVFHICSQLSNVSYPQWGEMISNGASFSKSLLFHEIFM